MPNFQQLYKWAPDVLSAGIGAAIFFIFYGSDLLVGASPYLAAPVGDIAAEMGGYYHFANDGWHFPIFSMPSINMPEGSNALFTGGVPLLALFAKVVHWVWGTTPNLFGFWYLLCCILQTHSLYFLMKQITDERPLLLGFASAIGGLTYAFLTRTGHVSLFCHFFCIYAVGLVIATTNLKYKPATILVGLAVLVYTSMFVFAYLAICNTVMFFAGLASLYQQRKIAVRDVIQGAIIFSLVLLVLAFVGGYFWAVGKATPAAIAGYSVYAFNIGSLMSPPQSVLFPFQPIIKAWWEGDFYLGAGILALWSLLIVSGPVRLARMMGRHWPIFVALVILTLYSISTRVSFLNWVLVDFSPPRILTPILGMARTAGRLFWPIGYLLIGGAIALTIARFRRAGPLLVAVTVLIAGLESTGTYGFVRGLVTTERAAPFNYESLQKVMNGHRAVTVYPTFWCSPSISESKLIAYQQVELTSGRAGLASNSSITARQIKNCSSEQQRAQDAHLNPGQLLIFMDRSTFRNSTSTDKREEYLSHCRVTPLDNDQALMCSLLWDENSQEKIAQEKIAKVYAGASDTPLEVNSEISFASASNRDLFILSGWSAAEKEFTWSEGPLSRLEFKLPSVPSDKLYIEVAAYPYLRLPAIPMRDVDVIIDGVTVAKWTFHAANWQIRRLSLPAGLDGRNIQLAFRQVETRAPADFAVGDDPRHLGLAVKSLTLRQKAE